MTILLPLLIPALLLSPVLPLDVRVAVRVFRMRPNKLLIRPEACDVEPVSQVHIQVGEG